MIGKKLVCFKVFMLRKGSWGRVKSYSKKYGYLVEDEEGFQGYNKKKQLAILRVVK